MLDSLLTYDYGFILKDKIVITSVSVDSNLTKAKTLDEVKIKSGGKPKSKAEVVNDLFTTGIYSTQSSIFIDNINNPPNDTKMRGVQFVKNRVFILQVQNGNFVNTRNFSLQNAQPWVVGITIDEIPAGLSDLDQLNVDEIALVKFFDVGHITVGMINPGGLLAVYTKGNKSKISVDKLTSKPTPEKVKPQEFDYEGFGNNVVIFSEKDKNVNAYKSAYWNPSIILLRDQNNFSFNTFMKRFSFLSYFSANLSCKFVIKIFLNPLNLSFSNILIFLINSIIQLPLDDNILSFSSFVKLSVKFSSPNG